jgi:hypothetical protein
MEAAQKKKARKEVKKAHSADLMDLSEKFTTVSKMWAVAPNEELEPPSLGLSAPNLSYFDRYHKFDPVYLFEKLCPPPLLAMIVEASEKCHHLHIIKKCKKGITLTATGTSPSHCLSYAATLFGSHVVLDLEVLHQIIQEGSEGDEAGSCPHSLPEGASYSI